MKEKMLENLVIEYCAPTLAGIKSGGLFSYFYDSKESAMEEMQKINLKLNKRGVFAVVLLWRNKSALVYTYRSSLLEKELKRSGVMELLSRYGYLGCDIETCLKHLRCRLADCDGFPHEIGVFLGYPLEDVIGFIDHKGDNCKYCGLWKVYCNECEALKMFEKIRKCTENYLRLFAQGRSIAQMTVST